jgi:hypothetical protein
MLLLLRRQLIEELKSLAIIPVSEGQEAALKSMLLMLMVSRQAVELSNVTKRP